MLILRWVHVLAAIFWGGSVFMLAGFILPTVKALGQGGTGFLRHLMMHRRLGLMLPSAAGLTILSGLGMFWRDAAISGGAFQSSPAGISYSIGAACAIVAAVIGGAVSGKTAAKMVALSETMHSAGGAPTPDQQASMAAMSRRLTGSTHAVAGLIFVAATTMAIARYL